ncbi:hypothetical protein JCM19037_2081 [Geomicrobium sp. JCM 19037]|nr:hypothetical protein JCM19037_2081 [Geomicrobium sp. JCM 19037]
MYSLSIWVEYTVNIINVSLLIDDEIHGISTSKNHLLETDSLIRGHFRIALVPIDGHLVPNNHL